MDEKLIKKYNIPEPRYTSYPTVPYWDAISPVQEQWKQLVKKTFALTNDKEGISIYIHLPFCETLCAYCACNIRITTNHAVEMPYIRAILREWKMYRDIFGDSPKIKEIHLVGGTPTFFSPGTLQMLIEKILSNTVVMPGCEFSFEAHPNYTTFTHLKILYDMGFRRLSLGIQDFNPKVQAAINRIQTFSQTKKITTLSREIGYTSVNYDLIYGLPFQTRNSIISTIKKVNELHPDRIAFYSYAYVPWIKPGQRKFTENDLPDAQTKLELYILIKKLLLKSGYSEIGMDYLALTSDSLYRSVQNKKLHRNFMGYTDLHTKLLIGLGASSISDAWQGFVQNSKTTEDYYAALNAGKLPFFKGHLLTPEDLILRKHIINLVCYQETSWKKEDEQCDALYEALERLKEMKKDNLVSITPLHLKIKPEGKPFMRNVCMAFDARLWKHQPQTQLFSAVI